MPEGQVTAWDYKEKHVDSNIASGSNFINSAHALIYAAYTEADNAGKLTVTPFKPIGVVQAWNWGENKVVEQIFEIGSDAPYTVPGRTTGQISIARMLIDGADLATLLSAGTNDGGDVTIIKSLREITKPFHMLFAAFSNAQTGSTPTISYSRVFQNCWITSRSESFTANQVVVAENANILYEVIPSVTIGVKSS